MSKIKMKIDRTYGDYPLRPHQMADPITPLSFDGAGSAAPPRSSSDADLEGDFYDHGPIVDQPLIAVGGRRRERAVCVRARRWL